LDGNGFGPALVHVLLRAIKKAQQRLTLARKERNKCDLTAAPSF